MTHATVIAEFGPSRPHGRKLAFAMILAAAFFVWMAYLLHCDGLTCRPPRPGSKTLPVLTVLTVVSLGLAWLVRNAQGISAELRVAADHLHLEASGAGVFERDRTIPLTDIVGFRYRPGYRSRGFLILQLAPDTRSRNPSVTIPLDGLNGKPQAVFDAIARALMASGRTIQGGRFAPGISPFEQRWTVAAPRA